MKVAVVGPHRVGRVRPGGDGSAVPARSSTPSRPGRSPREAAQSRPSQLARLAGSCVFFTALGSDELGRRSRAELEQASASRSRRFPRRSRRAAPSRTSTTPASGRSPCSSEKLRPARRRQQAAVARARGRWTPSSSSAATPRRSGTAARPASSSPPSRELATLQEAGVQLDALVGSGEDEAELYRPGDLDPAPQVAVTTAGGLGGWLQPGGPFRLDAAPGPGRRHLRSRRLLRRRA